MIYEESYLAQGVRDSLICWTCKTNLAENHQTSGQVALICMCLTLQVVLIQACQGDVVSISPDSSMDARRGVANEQDDRHIRLRRPNTVLLLATVAGDRAYRGFYTGAIADELRRVDGVTDIHDMHMKAVDKMKKDASLPQLPEYRATLLKQLILPIDEPGRLLLALAA